MFFAVPTLYAAILADPECTPELGAKQLRLCFSAGEPLPPDLLTYAPLPAEMIQKWQKFIQQQQQNKQINPQQVQQMQEELQKLQQENQQLKVDQTREMAELQLRKQKQDGDGAQHPMPERN